ncbi:MAG: type II toxin-antitoxin system RelE/ParE family toxin [Planctomycetota bacterium]
MSRGRACWLRSSFVLRRKSILPNRLNGTPSEWYAERSIEAANDFDAELNRAISQISSDPDRFPKCEARHRYFLLRRFPFHIIYRVAASEIIVVAVAHNSRSPDYWSDR